MTVSIPKAIVFFLKNIKNCNSALKRDGEKSYFNRLKKTFQREIALKKFYVFIKSFRVCLCTCIINTNFFKKLLFSQSDFALKAFATFRHQNP